MNNTFDSLMYKAKEVLDLAGKKTGEIANVSKLKLEAVSINNKIKKLYENLGCTVYSMAKGEYENNELVDSLMEDIDDSLDELAKITKDIANLKNMQICPICSEKNSVDNYYCVKCGGRLKTDFTDNTSSASKDDIDDIDDIDDTKDDYQEEIKMEKDIIQ